LVARYEYTPGFENIDDVGVGGRVHYWLGDHIKLGVTSENQESSDMDTSLNGMDVTLRKNARTWLKVEHSTSEGPVSSSLLSDDGGFSFNEAALDSNADVKANGRRVDARIGFEDVFDIVKGNMTVYHQRLDPGYAAPGLIAQNETTQTGGSVLVPMSDLAQIKLKVDTKVQKNALEQRAFEAYMESALTQNWLLTTGLRHDKRTDNSPVVPLTQEEGKRNDYAVKLTYDSRERWRSYGYVQDTVQATGNRERNSRVGVGGDYLATDRFKINGEVSSGSLGTAVHLGTDYKMTGRTDLYTNYALENERADNGIKARKGNLVSGFKTRYSDSASMYMEENYTHGEVPTGLTHALGFELAVSERLNFGGHIDVGTLRDNTTSAEIDRTAAGVRAGYRFGDITYAGALEYRVDETQAPDTSVSKRATWLTKNSVKYKINPNWRLIGKLNYSVSESSLGEYYDGNFTEAVWGYAYRPVSHDALNALVKYTYFYNLPSTGQVTLANTATEYIQKSHIVSLDAMYDLTQTWSVGGKYAYRRGELSQDRVNPQFFQSNASLYIVRVDWHFVHRWDGLLEGRLLDLPDAGDRRSGALIGVYRHVGENVKLGLGYNFTDFSDDLTDLDYDSQGFFVNVIGKF
jgi:hypothetical protein